MKFIDLLKSILERKGQLNAEFDELHPWKKVWVSQKQGKFLCDLFFNEYNRSCSDFTTQKLIDGVRIGISITHRHNINNNYCVTLTHIDKWHDSM